MTFDTIAAGSKVPIAKVSLETLAGIGANLVASKIPGAKEAGELIAQLAEEGTALAVGETALCGE